MDLLKKTLNSLYDYRVVDTGSKSLRSKKESINRR